MQDPFCWIMTVCQGAKLCCHFGEALVGRVKVCSWNTRLGLLSSSATRQLMNVRPLASRQQRRATIMPYHHNRTGRRYITGWLCSVPTARAVVTYFAFHESVDARFIDSRTSSPRELHCVTQTAQGLVTSQAAQVVGRLDQAVQDSVLRCGLCCTMRSRSTTKVPGKCMLMYYRRKLIVSGSSGWQWLTSPSKMSRSHAAPNSLLLHKCPQTGCVAQQNWEEQCAER